MIRLRPSGVDDVLIKRVRDWYEPGPGVFITTTASFSPASLFTTGVNGAWYDPSDITTLYRDAAGNLPVTAVEQPVGLMLDKSKGLVLGPELVPTTYSGTGGTGWTITTNTVTRNASIGNCQLTLTAPLVLGKFYYIQFTVTDKSGDDFAIRAGSGSGDAQRITSNGLATFRVQAVATGAVLWFGGWNGTQGTFTVTNISVRELPGNHAFNSSGNSANFPVLSARYNLLTKTEDISAADWTKGGATAASTSSLLETATTGAHSCTLSPTTVAATYIYSVKLKANGRTRFAIAGTASLGGNLGNGIFFDLSTGSYVSGATGTPSITALSDGWYQVTYMWTALAGSGPLGVYLVDSGTNISYTGDVTKGMFIKEADLRVVNDALNQPAYQRVNTATDYDTVGFKPYLRFNGTNQWLQTNSVDFTYGDKMFVSAGVRKLKDGADGCLFEHGVYGQTGFAFYIPQFQTTKDGYGVQLNGIGPTYFVGYTESIPAPDTKVISSTINQGGSTSQDKAALRLNGASKSLTYANSFTPSGVFANYPLYIGARAGSSLWFNGRLYQMVVAGKQASAAEITSTETYINTKTGAF